MAKIKNAIELNIYDDELEVVRQYKTYGLRWGTFQEIMAMQDELQKIEGATDAGAIEQINDMLKKVFPTITDEDLNAAFADDLFTAFKQAINVAKIMAKN